MRSLTLPSIHRYRHAHPLLGVGDHACGSFLIPSPLDKKPLRIIAASDEGWDHVSVSLATRTPRWEEMAFIKELFFEAHETVMQLHVAAADHINHHPHCLHLWRPHKEPIPAPPKWMV